MLKIIERKNKRLKYGNYTYWLYYKVNDSYTATGSINSLEKIRKDKIVAWFDYLVNVVGVKSYDVFDTIHSFLHIYFRKNGNTNYNLVVRDTQQFLDIMTIETSKYMVEQEKEKKRDTVDKLQR
ncbi:MAG: hypothetical protein PHT83_05500 [Bacilli bacterium]|nr:hypothetical protein [Patescibacteria group bacterium]MDD3382929.1 hypothetical protein [Bacilli bacterium]